MPYKVNEKRRHRIPKARYRVKNWRSYDAALRRRGDLTVWVTPAAMAAWTPPRNGSRGRPLRYSAIAVETEFRRICGRSRSDKLLAGQGGS